MTHFGSKLIFVGLLIGATTVFAEKVEVKDDGESETKAAKFFRKSEETPSKTVSSGDHYLGVHIGSFLNATSYRWGDTAQVSNGGRLNLGMTYKLDEFTSFMDSLIRADILGYELPEGKPIQLALLWMLMLPDSASRFPLYFGVGVGPGFFFQQLSNESFVSLNYQLVAGARFFNILDSVGFFFETGMKNHLFMLSDGQFNGFFFSIGGLFVF